MAGDLADVYLQFEDDPPLEGDCTDLQHPGKDTVDANGKTIKGGWIQIKSFSFGFGFETSSSKAAAKGKAPINRELYDYYRKQGLSQAAAEEAASRPTQSGSATPPSPKPKEEKTKEWGHSKALTFEKCRISKSADKISDDLVQYCHDGEPIAKVTLEACRPSGADDDAEIKLPFLQIIFEDVLIRSCNLRLATEGLPTEELEFEYNKVTIKTLWTDNATGNRLPEQPIWASWDLEAQKEADDEDE